MRAPVPKAARNTKSKRANEIVKTGKNVKQTPKAPAPTTVPAVGADPTTVPAQTTVADLDPDQPMTNEQREECLRRHEEMGEAEFDAALDRVWVHREQRLDAANRVILGRTHHPHDYGYADLAPEFDAYVPPLSRGGELKPVTVHPSPVSTPVKTTLESSP